MKAPAGQLRIDAHVHLVGNGASGSGCVLNLRGLRSLQARLMLRHLGLPAHAVQIDLDTLYRERLMEMLRASSLDKLVLLAHDYPHDHAGRALTERAPLYVPNRYLLSVCAAQPRFLAAVSIHPARADALEELERCHSAGAVMVKLLPSVHNIDCADPRFERFWGKLAELRMPLLLHSGGELALPVIERAYADPIRFRAPLECGVTVIAAHCGTSSGAGDPDYLPVWRAMLDRYPQLYGDNSGLLTPLRSRYLRELLDPDLQSRIVHGSDLPVPVMASVAWARGLIDFSVFSRWNRVNNALERDLMLKAAIGFLPETGTRFATLLSSSVS